MINNKKFTIYKRALYSLLIVCCLFFISTEALAQPKPVVPQIIPPTDYRLLEPIPQLVKSGEKDKTNATTYLVGLFKLVIGLTGVMAVVMIIYGGVVKMSSDAVSGQSKANEIISNAIWGLLLAISAWLILYTINPRLVEIKFDIAPQVIRGSVPGGPNVSTTTPTGGGRVGDCVNCQNITVAHKLPPQGCAAPGPCVVDVDLNNSLARLNSALKQEGADLQLLVTESYPPTRTHACSCHSNGTCVDARFYQASKANDPKNIKMFIEKAGGVGLNAVYEVLDHTKAKQIRDATGLGTSQVIVVQGITGEHFSVYKNSCSGN